MCIRDRNEAALLRVREKSDTSRPKSGGGRMKKGDRVPLDITPLGYEYKHKDDKVLPPCAGIPIFEQNCIM